MDIIYSLLSGLLPPMIWLILWTREDKHPEPRVLLLGCFMAGMCSVFLAVVGEHAVASYIADEKTRYIVWAIIEEITKFIGIALIGLISIHNDEPIDAIIYSITVALGFAAVENALFVMGQTNLAGISSGINAGSLRFIGPTLVHTVSSAIIGVSYGFVFYKGIFLKTISVTIGIILASALHATFNLSLLNASKEEILKSFAMIWVATVILIILFEEIKSVRPKYYSQMIAPK